jgi:NDP-sugar pyrophosphorylase family protein
MANDIRISQETKVGEGFIPPEYLRPGENEYRIRDEQLRSLGKEPSSFRPLSAHELEVLVRNNNTCGDWSLLLVKDPFCPELLRNNLFFGLIRISRLEHVTLEHHDISMEAGIFNSQIIACDIGDNCVVSNCTYLSHYIVDDHCILINNAEMQVSNHSKFGNGIVMESEDESVRITLDVMNENGGRWIYPFNGMLPGDAWLWAKFRDRKALMTQFARLTDAQFDHRLGRYGVVGRNSVLKHNRIIKDSYIGESAYIKGSNKLKNLTINSSAEAPTQIGEGVELVNGILGYGCRVFYGCKAVRFVMCDNSALKYGARLIHSVLGENSTVSCCEILNNLIFPAHEQHHNTSFLIASLIKGQSNLAAGATIGSNHNSRAPDGEIEAGRGFWPGLCTSVKHSSRFASFCLLSKSDYKHELDIKFPFCLVDSDETEGRLMLAPGWWWHSNTYALMRNEKKFRERDRRIDHRIQFIYSPFALDTMSEIFEGLAILERATGEAAMASLADDETNRSILGDRVFALMDEIRTPAEKSAETDAPPKQPRSRGKPEKIQRLGAHILASAKDALPFDVQVSGFENSARHAVVIKPCKAWRSYREMLLWFAVQILLPGLEDLNSSEEGPAGLFEKARTLYGSGDAMEMQWENLGGFLVSHSKLEHLLTRIEDGSIQSWDELHGVYRELSSAYEQDARTFAWGILGYLSLDPESAAAAAAGNLHGAQSAQPWPTPSKDALVAQFKQARDVAAEIAQRVYATRAKDWSNPFRKSTFRNETEQAAVYGRIEDNGAIQSVRREMEATQQAIDRLLSRLGAEKAQ